MKKTLAIVAVLAMVLSLIGVAAFSARADEVGGIGEDVSETISEGSEEVSNDSQEASEASEEASETSEKASEAVSEEASEGSSEAPPDEPPAETDLWIAIDRTVGAAGRDVKVDFTVKQNPGFWGISLYVYYDDSVMTLKSVDYNPAFRSQIVLQPVWVTENPFVLRYFTNSLTADFTQTGVLATATFTVAEDVPVGAATDIRVRWRDNDVINVDLDNVPLVVWSGSVRVVPADELPAEPSEEPLTESSAESGEESSGETSEEFSEEPSVESSPESAGSADVSDGTLAGDANGDNSVDMKDVLKVRKFIAGMGGDIDETAADVNHDGSVDMKDVLLMRKFIAGIISRPDVGSGLTV